MQSPISPSSCNLSLPKASYKTYRNLSHLRFWLCPDLGCERFAPSIAISARREHPTKRACASLRISWCKRLPNRSNWQNHLDSFK
eukprot:4745011-Amphidinium_carterae.1